MNPPEALPDALTYASLMQVLFTAFVLGAVPGLAVVTGLAAADRTERLLWRLAAPGLGLFLFASALAIAVWTSGRYHPGLGHVVWLGGSALAWSRAWRRWQPRADLGALLLALALAAALGVLVYGPVRGLPASPDYDGTADGYLAAITKLGGSYPEIRPLGDERSITVNAPPAVPVLGAYVSDLTGVYVARTQLALSGAAWVFYTLTVPIAAWYVFAGCAHPAIGTALAAVLSYSLGMKWNYYDGSNLRLHAMLGLMLVTALWLRRLAGARLGGWWIGGGLGLLIYTHHRYLLLGALSIGFFLALRAARQIADRRTAELRDTLLWTAQAAAAGALVIAPFLWRTLSHLLSTQAHPVWSAPRIEGVQMLRYLERFQGLDAIVGGLCAAILLAVFGRGRPTWRYLAVAMGVQTALLSDRLIHTLLPFLKGYLDAMAVGLSGFSDVRPLALAAALLLPVEWARRGGRGRAEGILLGLVLALVGARAAWLIRVPISSCYTYLTPGDYAALSWIRDNTEPATTLVLNYAWDDIPDAELVAEWKVDSPRASFNMESFWVTPVSERRSVFHWLNRHLHQRLWNVIAQAPSGYVPELVALNRAYLHPDEPASEAVLRRNRVTHVFVTPLMHLALQHKLAQARYLRLRYLAPPPFSGYFARPDSGYVPPRPELAAAVYEVLPG